MMNPSLEDLNVISKRALAVGNETLSVGRTKPMDKNLSSLDEKISLFPNNIIHHKELMDGYCPLAG